MPEPRAAISTTKSIALLLAALAVAGIALLAAPSSTSAEPKSGSSTSASSTSANATSAAGADPRGTDSAATEPAGSKPLTVPKQPKIIKGSDGRSYVANQLLVSTSSTSTKEEITDILKDLRGTVVKEIKGPRLTFLVIEVPEGTLDKTEKKLTKDKHFSSVQRNFTTSIRPQ